MLNCIKNKHAATMAEYATQPRMTLLLEGGKCEHVGWRICTTRKDKVTLNHHMMMIMIIHLFYIALFKVHEDTSQGEKSI